MKTFLMTLFFYSLPAFANKVLVTIPVVHCSSCVRSISGAFDSLLKEDGIDANFKTKVVTLVFNTEISNKEIRKKLKSIGYRPTQIKRVNSN